MKTFPFTAIVEQSQLKKALLLCAVDPTIGGVLIRGDKGTAKSTAARALSDILPFIDRVVGCGFNCEPGISNEHCQVCNESNVITQPSPVPFVTLPLGATEDRVLGTLDIEKALQGGTRVFQPGLMAAAHRGILYIDEVNLLPDHLVDVLLDTAAMGINTVQREGLSIHHPSQFTLVGTMNMEEGDLRPQLLDRFGLMIEVKAPSEKKLRAEVVRRRIAFETNPENFVSHWSEEQQAIREQLSSAQTILSTVTLADDNLDLISHLCCEFDVASLRADIVMHKAARAFAALDGRHEVTSDDIRNAAELALPHRRRRKPFEQPGLDQERLDDLMQQTNTHSESQNEHSNEDNTDQTMQNDDESAEQQVFTASAPENPPEIRVASDTSQAILGKRSIAMNTQRGRVIRAIPDQSPSSLAVGATLRSAALRDNKEFKVTRNDLHQQIRTGKSANLILFVVDASGSMAAQRRMESVKGAVLSLLNDAYKQRDYVAVIAFCGESAQLLLSPTRSVDVAEQHLQDLPTGGRTPLPHAMRLAFETLDKNDNNKMPPLLVLLTDGKANVTLTNNQNPWQETLQIAELLANRSFPALVLDTETGYLRLGRARQLAEAMAAEYLTLEDLSSDNLAITIRHCMQAR